MRPIKLTMKNFGPFIDETLDFTQLKSAVFLIYGPTGSGKTTIFDAMCYALYHEASSPDRMVKGLKSDFVGEEALAQVDFTFEIGQDTYRVVRTPPQERMSQRGGGITTQKHEVALYRLSQGEESLIAHSVEECDATIAQIIGLSAKQFRQIVMLPQGEFSRLLRATSNERQDLLKSIFKMDHYEAFAAKVEEHLREQGQMTEKSRIQMTQEMGHLRPPENSPLAEAIKNQEETLEVLLNQVAAADEKESRRLEEEEITLKADTKSLGNHQAALGAGERLNARFIQWDAAKERARRLKEEEPKMEALGQKLAQVKKAQALTPLKKAWDEARHRHRQLEEEMGAKEEKYAFLLKGQGELEERVRLGKTPAYLKETEVLITASQNHAALAQTMEDHQAQEKEGVAILEEYQGLEAQQKEMEDLQKSLEAKRRSKAKNETAIAAHLSRRGDVREKGTALKETIEDLKKVEEGLNTIRGHREALRDLDAQRLMDKQSLAQWQQERDRIEAATQKNAAGELAHGLLDGTPCPVCGSVHHPQLAQKVDLLANPEDLKKARERCNALEGSLASVGEKNQLFTRQIATTLEAVHQAMEKATGSPGKEVMEVEAVVEHRAALEEEKKALVQEYRDINRKIEILEEENTHKLEAITAMETQLTNWENQGAHYQECQRLAQERRGAITLSWQRITAAAQAQSFTLHPQNIPGDCQALKALAAQKKAEAQGRREASEKAQAALESHRQDLSRWEGDLASSQKTLKAAAQASQEKGEAFEAALNGACLSPEDYKNGAAVTQEAQDQWEKALATHRQDTATLAQLLADFTEELAGVKPLDLKAMEEACAALQEQITQRQGKIATERQRIAHNQNQAQKLKTLSAQYKREAHTQEILLELADTIKGKVKGRPKIKFENYILSAYLSDILDSANLFLKDSTNGRYHLMIAQDTNQKNSQGLDIAVDDAYTGKCRSASSLSGGETFVAALSMALGLSDTILSNSGGIALDTLFIDEGFATLDGESLDKAMNCLTRLRNNGRTVGIISHVEGLKERVDARVRVEKTETGSHLHSPTGGKA